MEIINYDQNNEVFVRLYGIDALEKLENERMDTINTLVNTMSEEEMISFRQKYVEILEAYNQQIRLGNNKSAIDCEKIADKLSIDEKLLGWKFVEYVREKYGYITKSLPDEYLFIVYHHITRLQEQDMKSIRRAYGSEPVKKKSPEHLYTTDEAAEALRLHPATLRKYIREGKINALKIGKQWKIKQREITKIKKLGIA
jgi:excisionase family DNA binding protein